MPDFAPLHGSFTVLHGSNRERLKSAYFSKRSGRFSRFAIRGLRGCVYPVELFEVHGPFAVVIHNPHTPIGASRRLWAACARNFSPAPRCATPLFKVEQTAERLCGAALVDAYGLDHVRSSDGRLFRPGAIGGERANILRVEDRKGRA